VGTPSFALGPGEGCPAEALRARAGFVPPRELRLGKPAVKKFDTNLPRRNPCVSHDTRELRPWDLVATIEFANEASAVHFEKYLKSGSGRAFAKRHLV
jgi:hypothetical protein